MPAIEWYSTRQGISEISPVTHWKYSGLEPSMNRLDCFCRIPLLEWLDQDGAAGFRKL